MVRSTNIACPRCRSDNRGPARFCAHCGLSLTSSLNGTNEPGKIRHPQPLPAPAGFAPVTDAADLFYKLESAWGGQRVLDTENIGLLIFNAGYPLREVTIRATAESVSDAKPFAAEYAIAELTRGKSVRLEISSWEMPDSVKTPAIRLGSAEFGMDEQ